MSERIRIKRRRGITLIDALDDPRLFKPWFKNRRSWAAWRTFIAALFALPMDDEQLQLYRQCTKRTDPPAEPAKEADLVVGRRGGKSRIMALIAVWLACFKDYSQYLAPGERGTVLVIAADRAQARTIMNYAKELIRRVPMLKRLVIRQTRESIDLANGITIEVGTASFRSTRGYTIVAGLLDELAFWDTGDAAEPDEEVLAAIRPGMLTIPNAVLICASSPHAKKGVLWKQYQKHFGKDGPTLVWQAPTIVMNPLVPVEEIDLALENDPAKNRAEYLAEFRDDLEQFISREVLAECIDQKIYERPPKPGNKYFAFVDPSGGSNDSMTSAIAHREGRDLVVVDCIREVKAPFDPESVVEEFAKLFKTYKVKECTGDRYGAQWVAKAFERQRIKYIPSDLPKSALYVDLLPVLNSKQVRLLDHERLTNQLVALERRVARGGKDSIDHPRGSHDDVANAVAGVSSLIVLKKATYDIRGFHSDEEMQKDQRAPYWNRMMAAYQGRMWVCT